MSEEINKIGGAKKYTGHPCRILSYELLSIDSPAEHGWLERDYVSFQDPATTHGFSMPPWAAVVAERPRMCMPAQLQRILCPFTLASYTDS